MWIWKRLPRLIILGVFLGLVAACVPETPAAGHVHHVPTVIPLPTTPPITVLPTTIPVPVSTMVPVGSSVPSTTIIPVFSSVPPEGHATAYGCNAAVAYLRAYADPKFGIECPGPNDGYEATTCYGGSSGYYPCAPYQYLIDIEVPCPAAYMNEASNSWVVDHKSDAPIDPYGHC